MRILIVRTDRMGDLLMSLPVLGSIRREMPQARLTLLLRKGLEPLLEGHPDAHELLTFDAVRCRGWLAALPMSRRLRRFRFDAVLVLNPTKLFHLACFLAGIPLRIGYRRKWGGLLSRSIPDTKGLRPLHEVEYNLELARLLGIQALEREILLPTPPEIQAEATHLLENHGVRSEDRPVAIHPWTSNPEKSWALEQFQDLLVELGRRGVDAWIIGGPEEMPAMARWRSRLPDEIGDLVGKIPLRLLPAFLGRCALLVSNDSGPVHVAAAVGTSAIVVAPREHAAALARWKPLGAAHVTLLSPSADQVAAAVDRIRAASPPVSSQGKR